MGLKSEIFEQPVVLERLVDTQWPKFQEVARSIRQHDIDTIFLAARGTSDNAGIYAKYLWGAYNRLPIALAAPSLFSIYRTPPKLRRTMVMGISQSGQSPDIISVVAEGRRQGALTLAITNAPDSPLAQESALVIDVSAGPEMAVAATKTYTAQLMAVALLSVALAEGEQDITEGEASASTDFAARFAALQALPATIAQVLSLDATIARAAERYRYMTQSVIIGRGYNYATAFEWALKLKELTYTVSMPYSSADFRHGPIAVVAQGFPVFAVAPGGAVFDDLLTLLKRLKHEHRVELLVISDQDAALSLADTPIPLPQGLPEWLTPMACIVPAQLFCYYLTLAKGLNVEAPRGLRKVTKTQ